MWLLEFKLIEIKYDLKFNSSVALATVHISHVTSGKQLHVANWTEKIYDKSTIADNSMVCTALKK